ncbi:MAG: hypothetical protein ACTS6G_01310, partial [Candidatus Hodgkinia cicadicola]
MLVFSPLLRRTGASATQTMRETTQLLRLTNATLLPAAASMVCVITSSCFVRRSSFALPFSEGALLEIIWSAAPAAILASMCSTSL